MNPDRPTDPARPASGAAEPDWQAVRAALAPKAEKPAGTCHAPCDRDAPARVQTLADLRNVGRAALADFAQLGIRTIAQLADAEADDLYRRLCIITRQRHDPCVHDVFTAAIHQARTGEARNWWTFTPARKARQAAATFPVIVTGRNGDGGEE